MQNLIIGCGINYSITELKPWVLSVNQVVSVTTDRIMIVGGQTTAATRQWLIDNQFQLVEAQLDSQVPVHVLRFRCIYDYLKDHHQRYQYVVTTDVRDVYFQLNPFEWLYILEDTGKKLAVGSESIRYLDEPWGNGNLLNTYGSYIHDLFKHNKIYNVGTIGGRSEYVKDLMFNIFTNAINRPEAICDQAVFNVLIQTQPYRDCVFFAEQSDAWACQAGTTSNPGVIDQFGPFLTEAEPIFENGLVKTHSGVTFSIVHQYDRVPVWQRSIQARYQ